jgi:hypothetical protein
MGPIDAVWHVLNFFWPALGLGVLGAAAVKLLWRRELAGVTGLRLAAWGVAAGAVALVAGLLIFGRDGRMVTYALLVLFTALAFWAGGCRPKAPAAANSSRKGRKATP